MATHNTAAVTPAAAKLNQAVLGKALERTGSVQALADKLQEDRGNTSKRLRGLMDMTVSQLAAAAEVAGVEVVAASEDGASADSLERAHVERMLAEVGGSRTKGAVRLGWSRGKLLHKLRGWGLLTPRS